MKKAKSVLSVLLALVMVLCTIPVAVGAESLTEVPEGYIGVYTVEDLYSVRNDLTANYILMNDIDLTEVTAEGGDWNYGGRGWNPIGSEDRYSYTSFSGIFDGNGYHIKGMNIDITSYPSNNYGYYYVGLFSYLTGTIKNLNVDGKICVNEKFDATHSSVDNYVTQIGGIVGEAGNSAVIENCVSHVTVNVELDIGLYKSASSNQTYIGGIVGKASKDTTIIGCANTADIRTSNGGNFSYQAFCSGISGCGGTISKCYNTGCIDAVNTGSTYSGSYSYQYYGYVYVSGISNRSAVDNCYNIGNINGAGKGRSHTYISGINYKDSNGGSSNDCYNVGKINDTGYAYENTYAVSPNLNSYNKCYYLENVADDSAGATSLTETQMKLKSMYSTWDFDTVWTMDGREDYPYPELRDVPLIFPDDYKTGISGSVTITGEAKVGSTLTAVITDLTPADATVTYEWKADGVVVGTEADYTVTQDDVGKEITLTVKGDGDFKGSLESSAVIGECVHALGEFTLNNDATCTKNETKSAVCEKCGATVTEEIEGTKLPHSFTNYVSDNNATCTADGTKTAKCDNCDATDTIADNGSAKGHTEEIIPAVEATCTEKGKTEGKKCSVCGEILVAQGETPALGHSFTNYASDNNATCTADGTKTAKCDRCDETNTVADEGSKLGHSFTNYVSNGDATCTADGTKTAKCDNCDATDTIADNGSAKGHTEEIIPAVEATCTEKGKTEGKKCSVCGEILVAQGETPALGHSFTNYASDNNATCTADGTKTAKCDRCDETNTVADEGSKLGHDESGWIIDKAPICTETGVKHTKCTVCGKTVQTEIIPAIGHKYIQETAEPTCEHEGSIIRICTVCKDEDLITVLPATGHTDADNDGHCDRCGKNMTGNCSCMCHKSGFTGFIYKIMRFFWKLFKVNKTCICGVTHY